MSETAERVRFELTHPVQIGARLLPAVRVADGWLSVEPVGRESGGRVQWRVYLDTPAGEYDSGEALVAVMPLGGEDWGQVAARALNTVCRDLATTQEVSGDELLCDWLPAALQGWRHEHALDFFCVAEDLGEE
ncbi:hypothetical protein [Micromonospora sp. NPDC005652]|uniref:hypothetical protein n=1 Tax=Micromonospora sp. NPDC005652 TaxID=3157046 RepID=UPI0033F8D7A3